MKTYTEAAIAITLLSIPACVGIYSGSVVLAVLGLIASYTLMRIFNIFN